VYLLAGRTLGDRIRTWLIGLSGAAAGVVFTAPTNGVIVPDDMPKGSEIFDAAPRAFAAVGSGVAALVIIFGALWSIARVVRGRTPAVGSATRHVVSVSRHAWANALIAIGTLTLSTSGSLAGRLGEDRAFAVTLVSGVLILFAGFLVGVTEPRRSESAAQQFAELVVG